MLKSVDLNVPIYLKKFLVREFDGSPEGEIKVERYSELGKLMHLASRIIPYVPQPKPVGGTRVKILYACKEKAKEIGPDKLPDLERQLDEIFRRTLIAEVRSAHNLLGGDYLPFIRVFLDRYDIQPDTDISSDQVRKIYRDYLARVDRQHRKKAETIYA